MPVKLEPPLTRSLGSIRHPGDRIEQPLTHGPALYLSRGGGRSPMPRWHRVRYGVHFPEHTAWNRTDLYRDGKPHHTGAYTCWSAWCGPTVHVGNGKPPVLTADKLPDDTEFALCGPCEGRAVGAGHPEIAGVPLVRTIFSPRRLDPPKRCPGSRQSSYAQGHWKVWEDAESATRWHHARCLVCGEVVKWWAGRIAGHAPGPGLVQGCLQHAWQNLVQVDGEVVCACQTMHVEEAEGA